MLVNKQYGLINLPIPIGMGNVLTTVSDRKIPHTSDNITIDYYTSDITSAQDYYAFGQLMPGRNWSSDSYKFGFNGKEKDDEVSGTGNQYDYGFRIYNPRIGKFLSEDPLTKSFPMLTPYQFASNSPIASIDLDGKEGLWYIFAKTGVYGATTAAIINGTEDGVKASVTNTYNLITKDAWKTETWKQAGLFLYEIASLTSPYEGAYIPTPRVDAKIQNFEDNVINGNAYSMSKALSEFGTDILTAYVGSKGLGSFSSFVSGAVKTPWGVAKQSLSVGALKGAVNAKKGSTLYRIGTTGKSAQGANAQFWSMENPLLDPESYAKKYNVPIENIKNADFIETATLKKNANFITREVGTASGSENVGKGIEVVVDEGGTTNNVITPIKK